MQTMALTYHEISQGKEPWVALGNFMNDWFDYEKDYRESLVEEPIDYQAGCHRWAVFCAAAVEYLCKKYNIPCPSWAYDPLFTLNTPWFDAADPFEPTVRNWLIQTTPEVFARRNIFCGGKVFANKYELAEQYRCQEAIVAHN